jgi:hypothetical protein
MIWFTYASNEKMIRETATKHISNLQIKIDPSQIDHVLNILDEEN